VQLLVKDVLKKHVFTTMLDTPSHITGLLNVCVFIPTTGVYVTGPNTLNGVAIGEPEVSAVALVNPNDMVNPCNGFVAFVFTTSNFKALKLLPFTRPAALNSEA
jgi:hypothetical protein